MTQPLQRLSTHLSYLEIEFRRQDFRTSINRILPLDQRAARPTMLGPFESQSVHHLTTELLERLFTFISYLEIEFGGQARLVAYQ